MTRRSSLFYAFAMSFCFSFVCRAATTWSELLEEIAAAEDGGTVYVEADMTYTSAISGVNKTVTIASSDENRFVLTRSFGDRSLRSFRCA